MFILEESQLLEDTIKDPSVLNLYKILRQQEPYHDRNPYIEDIINSEHAKTLLEFILKAKTDIKFSKEEKDELCGKLGLDFDDVTALALIVSASLTQIFAIDNFTGPYNESIRQIYEEKIPPILQDFSEKTDHTALAIDGHDVYHLMINPWILKAVQLTWDVLSRLGCTRRLLELEFLVWKHRYLTVHLMMLLEPAESIVNDLKKLQEFIFDHHVLNDTRDNKTQSARFNAVELSCELLQSALLRNNIKSCRKYLSYASEVSGISVEHTGALGKKTKFQQKDIAQLVVKVRTTSEVDATHEQSIDEFLPKEVQLDDDTLLSDISFVDETGQPTTNVQSLSIEAQLIVQSKLDISLKSEVMEESLKDEWTIAYLRSITNSATLWSIMFKALALRSEVERKHMRRVDRALRQMEELLKVTKLQYDNDNTRMRCFYSILPKPRWQLHGLLAEISLNLGLFKNALDIYLQVEHWEGAIKCYSALGQTNKAEIIILQELEKHETPYLYCLLGDVKDEIEFYEKSWTLSEKRFSRAKKSIGTYHYVRKQYESAIANYEQALQVNPSNLSILSMLAYCYLITERYEKAAESYRNMTYLDDSSFLAWNNLSKAYIKLNQKERAWRTLREAIKCNFEEWKIWENFMVVSMDIGSLDDVITAWHRILDIRGSHEDDSVLRALTYTLTQIPSSKYDDECKKLLRESLKLTARLSSTSNCTPTLWICYFKLLMKDYEMTDNSNKIDLDAQISKIVRALQRATPTSHVSDHDWYQIPENIMYILNSFDELADHYQYAFEILGPKQELWRQFKNFKLSTNNVMKTIERKIHLVS